MNNEIQDRPFESYHDNGQLWEKASYKDGILYGPYESYENGQLMKKGLYKYGEFK